jgi:hypothetical protein
MIEGLTGLAAVALAIIGLAHVAPWLLASISTLALGAAFLFEAGSIGARFSALERETGEEEVRTEWTSFGTLSVGFLAGCTGIALGILALLNIYPAVLVPIAIIIYGGTLIMDSGVRVRLSVFENLKAPVVVREMSREAASASSGIQVLVGLASVVLGILAVIGISGEALSLIALLTIGAVVLFIGSFTGARMVSMLRR